MLDIAKKLQIPSSWITSDVDLARAQTHLNDAFLSKRNDHAKRAKIANEALKISKLCADAWYV
jgi:hypothetical protein